MAGAPPGPAGFLCTILGAVEDRLRRIEGATPDSGCPGLTEDIGQCLEQIGRESQAVDEALSDEEFGRTNSSALRPTSTPPATSNGSTRCGGRTPPNSRTHRPTRSRSYPPC